MLIAYPTGNTTRTRPLEETKLNLSSFKRGSLNGLATALSLAAIATASIALAQPPDGGPPQGRPGGPGGPGRFGPPQGGPGGPGMPGGRMSVANVPAGALDAELDLSPKQKQDIVQLQDAFHKQQRSLMPNFGGPGRPGGPRGQGGPPNGGPGGPGGPPQGGPDGGRPDGGPGGQQPNFEQMRANMEKMRALEDKTVKQIEAVLTDSQRRALPGAMKELGAFGPAGIPLDVLGDLKLSSDQKSRIVAIAEKSQQEMRAKMDEARQSGDFQAIREIMQANRENVHKQVMAVLNADQRALVEKFVKEHPMRGPGGPGGFPGGPGGFGPGGPGGFPGGPGGPPPGGNPPASGA